MSRFYIQVSSVTNPRSLTRVWSGSVSHTGLSQLVNGRKGDVCEMVLAAAAAIY